VKKLRFSQKLDIGAKPATSSDRWDVRVCAIAAWETDAAFGGAVKVYGQQTRRPAALGSGCEGDVQASRAQVAVRQGVPNQRAQIQLDASVARRLNKRLQERLHRTCRVTGDRVPAASPSRASAVQPDCAEPIARAAPPPTGCPEHAQHPPAARLHQTDLLGPVHLRLHQPQCAWMAQRARGAPGSCVLSATSERISPH
jgi:hypothetical protein